MKVFIPRNIPGGRLNLNVNLGPITLSLVQLMILAIGLGLTLAIWNNLAKSGTPKITAAIFAAPIFLICLFIAFFRVSELTLIPFSAKMVRTHFLDTTKKFQINRERPDPKAILLAKSRKTEHEKVVQQKDLVMDEQSLKKLGSLSD